MPKKPKNDCLHCGTITSRTSYKYCSNQCQSDYKYMKYIDSWLSGEVVGLQRLGVVSRHIKRYLREKHENKCELCGWCEVNPVTKVVPLVADHIDGNWQNNKVENLRLICPNCDSLSATYAGLNRGKGRKERRVSQRIKTGRLLTDNLF